MPVAVSTKLAVATAITAVCIMDWVIDKNKSNIVQIGDDSKGSFTESYDLYIFFTNVISIISFPINFMSCTLQIDISHVYFSSSTYF